MVVSGRVVAEGRFSRESDRMNKPDRRRFLKTSAATMATMSGCFSAPPPDTSPQTADVDYSNAVERPVLGCIGTGDRWNYTGIAALDFADCAAVCDVDCDVAHGSRDKVATMQFRKGDNRHIDVYEDYRKILDRNDIDVVAIVTPDHWHAKIAIDAMQAGKDVYCEKPLTLTIREGKQIIRVLEETGRTFQVGTQQRSECSQHFLKAIAMIREGRIGQVQKVTCTVGGSSVSGAIPAVPVPTGLNWDMWLGQAPRVDYRFKAGGERGRTRCRYEFRWWYEYAGGTITDWGSHHVDIAQWAIDQNGQGQGVVSVDPLLREHATPLDGGFPTRDDRYNTATRFDVKCVFRNGVEMRIVSNSPEGNGILFEGTKGRFHVNRDRIKGAPVEQLDNIPLPEDAIRNVYGGDIPVSHIKNFFDCVRSRETPISDVWSHHRSLTTCHLANIALRLGLPLRWDPDREMITNSPSLNQWQSRDQRKGYEINIPI